MMVSRAKVAMKGVVETALVPKDVELFKYAGTQSLQSSPVRVGSMMGGVTGKLEERDAPKTCSQQREYARGEGASKDG